MQLNGKAIALIAVVLLLVFAGGGKDDVTPTPPEPPTPDTAPFDCDGLHVLIVYETGDSGIFTSAAMIDAFEDAGASWRVWDADTDVQEGEPWPTAFGLPRDSLPWIYISDGERGFTGPMPHGVDAVIDLVEAYE